MNPVQLENILGKHNYQSSELLSILQDIQDEENWLPREELETVAKRLDIPMTRVYRLSTFFKSLSLEPRGKYICQVCIGTTCHVRGAPRLVDKIELELDLKQGQTGEDMMFTVETVGCVGACALGPLVVINGDYHGNLTAEKLGRELRRIQKSEGKTVDDDDSEEE